MCICVFMSEDTRIDCELWQKNPTALQMYKTAMQGVEGKDADLSNASLRLKAKGIACNTIL